MNLKIGIPDMTSLEAFQVKAPREREVVKDTSTGFKDFLKRATNRLPGESSQPVRRGFHPKEANSLKNVKDQDTESDFDSPLKRMASALGISIEDFLKLLQMADLKPGELLDPQQSDDAAEKLLEFLDLTHIRQSSFLNTLAMSSAVAMTKDGISGDLQAISQPSRMDLQDLMVSEPVSGKDTEEIWAKIEARLKEMEGTSTGHDIHLSETDAGETAYINEENFNGELIGQETPGMIHLDTGFERMNVAGKGMQEGTAAGENSFDRAHYEGETTDVWYMTASNSSGESGVADGIQDTLQIPVVQGPQKGEEESNGSEIVPDIRVIGNVTGHHFRIQDSSASYRPVDITKYDIISQVADKVKVLLSQEKSEMVVDLKPDFLGRLSLKVVTERGMVSAQFIAESQQVKEILEGNMQLLKDALEKQGFSVQEFNVSVGQNQTGTSGNNAAYSQSREFRRIRAEFPATGVLSYMNMNGLERITGDNPYLLSGNSIDLTA